MLREAFDPFVLGVPMRAEPVLLSDSISEKMRLGSESGIQKREIAKPENRGKRFKSFRSRQRKTPEQIRHG